MPVALRIVFNNVITVGSHISISPTRKTKVAPRRFGCCAAPAASGAPGLKMANTGDREIFDSWSSRLRSAAPSPAHLTFVILITVPWLLDGKVIPWQASGYEPGRRELESLRTGPLLGSLLSTLITSYSGGWCRELSPDSVSCPSSFQLRI